MRLPTDFTTLDQVIDYILSQTADLPSFVVVGDSFGAVCASPAVSAVSSFCQLYRSTTLHVHAHNLASQYDKMGDPGWSKSQTHALFVKETPHATFCDRVATLRGIYIVDQLEKVTAPMLILTPEDDKLIGPSAVGIMRDGIRGAEEVVLPKTGHMFRFSHPVEYWAAIRDVLQSLSCNKPFYE
ncbi:Alpha/Beta hydrolase protein [Chytriomyces sp. MP71]|nr:Alpha/Beta hydrolase protein [Chytriomyces sp. MP71]